ncbi:MAG: hypothetical protein J1F09_01905 [Oscillospiraceae bacterium]|nr:hypothetical protein [Oscillospiraceae bacterium]
MANKQPPAAAATDSYIKAVDLNRRIITAAQLAQQSLYEMCTGFKEMRDSKLYKELGYSDFGDYCEQETGITRQQVHKYIAVAEKLPEDFVNPGLQNAQLGIKKLYLLTTLSEEERAEIADNTDLENTTVRELENRIKQLKTEKDKAVAERSAAEAQTAAKDDTIAALERAENELQNRITTLEADIKQLESRPVETAVQYVDKVPDNYISIDAHEKAVKEYNAQIEQLEDENLAQQREAHKEKTELERQLAEVQKQLEAAKTAPAKTDTDGVFKAYFENAYKSLDTLVIYVRQHRKYSAKVEALVDNIKKSLEDSQ